MTLDGRILVRPEPDGVVRIGEPPVAAAGVAQVHLPGMTVVVDPSDPAPATHALVDDPDAAGVVVGVLFGEAVAEAVAAGTSGAVPCDPSPELLDVEYTGRLVWLDENRSVPVDPALLEVEVEVSRAQLPGHEALSADPDLVARLVGLARSVREDPDLPLAQRLRDLFRLAAAQLPIGDPDFTELDHERELLALHDAWGSAGLSRSDLAWLAEQLAPQPAGHLGSTGTLEGVAALDWSRVPRALLPAQESSVRFEIRDGTVTVTVAPPAPSCPHPAVSRARRPVTDLVASVRSSAWPLPLAEGSLVHDVASRGWRGSFPIVPEAVELASSAPALDVDVRTATLDWRAPNQKAQRTAMARRWAARGIEGRRLASVPQHRALDDVAVSALRFAARIWNSVGGIAQAERCQVLAGENVSDVELGIAEQWLLMAGRGT